MTDIHYTPIKLRHGARNLAGKKFNRLSAIAPVGRNSSGSLLWLFMCDCGSKHVASGSKVTGGTTKSCGCFSRETMGNISRTHGLAGSTEHSSWNAMKTRCFNKGNPAYINYGCRGISVCDRWLKFENFLADMGSKPSKDHSLDRIDNDGDYTPENCRWATRTEQCNNRRNSTALAINGRTLTVAQWGRESGAGDAIIRYRISRGMSPFDAVFKPVDTRGPHQITINGEALNAQQWSKRSGISGGLICSRIKRGWAPQKAVFKPARKKRPNGCDRAH